MTTQENEQIWDELRELRGEIDQLRTRRSLLEQHTANLHELSKDLKTKADHVEQLAAQVENILTKDETNDTQA